MVSATVLCWAWVILMARDMYGSMDGFAAWMMTPEWDVSHLLLLWLMWAVMMSAMMLPTAAPVVLLYGRVLAHRSAGARAALHVYMLAAGYLLVWALFSVAATVLQRLLAIGLHLSPMMEPATPMLGAAVLFVAGLYQLTPLKRVCLRSCRSPLSFLLKSWRPGAMGALRIGMEQGVYCVGCCWALMLLLFAGGVMNLAVIAALTAWVLVEKLGPFGERGTYVSGPLLLGTGLWMLLQ
jgi:predicted metal-binding membrane protein